MPLGGGSSQFSSGRSGIRVPVFHLMRYDGQLMAHGHTSAEEINTPIGLPARRRGACIGRTSRRRAHRCATPAVQGGEKGIVNFMEKRQQTPALPGNLMVYGWRK